MQSFFIRTTKTLIRQRGSKNAISAIWERINFKRKEWANTGSQFFIFTADLFYIQKSNQKVVPLVTNGEKKYRRCPGWATITLHNLLMVQKRWATHNIKQYTSHKPKKPQRQKSYLRILLTLVTPTLDTTTKLVIMTIWMSRNLRFRGVS